MKERCRETQFSVYFILVFVFLFVGSTLSAQEMAPGYVDKAARKLFPDIGAGYNLSGRFVIHDEDTIHIVRVLKYYDKQTKEPNFGYMLVAAPGEAVVLTNDVWWDYVKWTKDYVNSRIGVQLNTRLVKEMNQSVELKKGHYYLVLKADGLIKANIKISVDGMMQGSVKRKKMVGLDEFLKDVKKNYGESQYHVAQFASPFPGWSVSNDSVFVSAFIDGTMLAYVNGEPVGYRNLSCKPYFEQELLQDISEYLFKYSGVVEGYTGISLSTKAKEGDCNVVSVKLNQKALKVDWTASAYYNGSIVIWEESDGQQKEIIRITDKSITRKTPQEEVVNMIMDTLMNFKDLKMAPKSRILGDHRDKLMITFTKFEASSNVYNVRLCIKGEVEIKSGDTTIFQKNIWK